MKTSFTPGPWKTDGRTIMDENLHVMYCCKPMHSSFSDEEAQANARLMAAAPELLYALELLFEVTKGNIPVGVSKVVWEAIAKARGETDETIRMEKLLP